MIDKERLEKLIKQGATIYRTYADVSVQEVRLNKNYMKVDNAFLWQKMKGAFKSCGTPLDKLFETKEDAEWHKEFGCIERTERLELPTWEDACDGITHNIPFTTPKCQKVEMIICDEYIDIVSIYQSIIDFSKPLTKENYTLACRKAKELFLGEKDE